MQRVEMLKIAESTQLIDPAEVVVSQGVVLSAEPVLTSIGGSSRSSGRPVSAEPVLTPIGGSSRSSGLPAGMFWLLVGDSFDVGWNWNDYNALHLRIHHGTPYALTYTLVVDLPYVSCD